MSRSQVILKPRRALPFFARHPWVFAGAIHQVSPAADPGAEVDLVTHDGKFVARGLYNPNSNIRVRLYSWNAEIPLDQAFWEEQIARAIRLRHQHLQLQAPQSACRLIFSEADGLSGLIVDRYADWLLVQFTSLAVAQRQAEIVEILQRQLRPAGIWLRTEKGIRDAEGLAIVDGLLTGEPPPRPLWIEEHGLRYGIDVVEGQKTGYFLDQRDNRLRAASFMTDRRVLDVCCYSGGFALNALRHGKARAVHAVDVSESALALAAANAEANGLASQIEFEKSDAFKALERLGAAGERFGAIVLDPPKLARHARGLEEALRGYHSLNRLAVDVLESDGILITCSCTGHVSREQFEQMLADVAKVTRRPIQILEARQAAPDHPTSVSCPETDYLKCYICRVA